MSETGAAPPQAAAAGGRLPPTTYDAFLGGRFRLAQPRRGFRCGSDALLLAAAAPLPARLIVDLGAGPGAVGFAAAAACAAAAVVLVEREPAPLALCAESLRLAGNEGIAARITLVEGDVTAPVAGWRPAVATEAADVVLANPPFFDPARTQGSPDALRDRARRRGPEGLSPWVESAGRLLRPDGALVLIAPAERLAELLTALAAGFGGLLVYPIRAGPDAPATRVIVGGRKGSRAPLRLAAGLVTHDGPRYGAAAEAVLRHAARLPGFDL